MTGLREDDDDRELPAILFHQAFDVETLKH
jgi:hypothetical protein